MKKRLVFVAGTFDGIHKGHKTLLKRAFDEGGAIVIGLTTDAFVKKHKKEAVKTYASRRAFIEKEYPSASVIPISDVYEPAASMEELDAIVVSSDTAFRASEINEIRKKRGLKILDILEVPMVSAEDRKSISSTRVRNGEIDRDGHLVMPDSMRDELAQPLGIVLSGTRIPEAIENHRNDVIVTVGDVATTTVCRLGVLPRLAIIDQKVNREPYDTLSELPSALKGERRDIQSGPGYISATALEVITTWARSLKMTFLVVDGEEDLLALPVILHAPIGSIVFYGQPPVASWACGPEQEGLVEVIVTKEIKKTVKDLLSQFVRS